MKTKSSITGKFVSKKTAAAKPDTTVVVSDYPTRMLRKLIRMIESPEPSIGPNEIDALIANVKKRMGWK